jgi:serine/threonine-protein kinase
VDTASSSRTVRGTSTTGRKFGGMSLPGLVLLILVVVAIAVAVAGGLGVLPLGADGAADQGFPTTTMVGSIGVDHGTRTGVE